MSDGRTSSRSPGGTTDGKSGGVAEADCSRAETKEEAAAERKKKKGATHRTNPVLNGFCGLAASRIASSRAAIVIYYREVIKNRSLANTSNRLSLSKPRLHPNVLYAKKRSCIALIHFTPVHYTHNEFPCRD